MYYYYNVFLTRLVANDDVFVSYIPKLLLVGLRERTETSELKETFGKQDPVLAQPQHVADSAAVKKAVGDKPGGIGYIDKGAVDASVKVVLAP